MKNKLYNVYFPIWLLIIFPTAWLIALPVNFALDSVVLWIAMATLHLTDKGKLFRRTILWIWLFGFLADLLGGALLLWASTGTSTWWYENIALPISLNPFSSVYGFIFVLLITIFFRCAHLCVQLFYHVSKSRSEPKSPADTVPGARHRHCPLSILCAY